VRGDGTSTIAQLAIHNLCEASPSSTRCAESDLEKDRDLLANLCAQGLDLRSVPAEGSEWIVKSYRSIMSKKIEENPAYAEDVTDLIGAEVKHVAMEAARLIRSEFAGVELITPDTGKPLQMRGGRVIEINTTPGLGPHFDLSSGSGLTNPAVVVLRCLLDAD
jgi:hypothetical protein